MPVKLSYYSSNSNSGYFRSNSKLPTCLINYRKQKSNYFSGYVSSNKSGCTCTTHAAAPSDGGSISNDGGVIVNSDGGTFSSESLVDSVPYTLDGYEFFYDNAGPPPLVPYDGPAPQINDGGVFIPASDAGPLFFDDGGLRPNYVGPQWIDGYTVDDAGNAFAYPDPWPPAGPYESDDLSWYDADYNDVNITCN